MSSESMFGTNHFDNAGSSDLRIVEAPKTLSRQQYLDFSKCSEGSRQTTHPLFLLKPCSTPSLLNTPKLCSRAKLRHPKNFQPCTAFPSQRKQFKVYWKRVAPRISHHSNRKHREALEMNSSRRHVDLGYVMHENLSAISFNLSFVSGVDDIAVESIRSSTSPSSTFSG